MRNLPLRTRMIGVGALLVASFALFCSIPDWGTLARWIRSFIETGPFQILLLGTGVVSFLRWFVLDRPAWPLRLFFLYWLMYQLTFHSRWMPPYIQVTYLFVITFFHFGAVVLIFVPDALGRLWTRWMAKPSMERWKKPGILAVSLWLVFWGFRWLLQPRVLDLTLGSWLNASEVLLFLVPLGASVVRRKVLGRTSVFAPGLVLFAVVQLLWSVVPRTIFIDSLLWKFFPIYVAFWLHLSLESVIRLLRTIATPLLSWPPLAERLDRWLGPDVVAAGMGGTRSEAPAEMPAWVLQFKAWAKTVPGRLKTGFSAGASRAQQYKRLIQWSAYAVALVSIGFWIGPKIYQRFFITVSEMTPSGLVGPRTVIRATFTGAVRPKDIPIQQVNCFRIEPPLEGIYRQENEKTIVFTPAGPLKPSSAYRVRLDTSRLTGVVKRLRTSARIEFNTEPIAVTEAKLFYTYDLVTSEERQLMGEVQFNAPVALEDLRKYIKVTRGTGQSVAYELEKSHAPTRYYFKTETIARSKEEQKIILTVGRGMPAIGGNVGLKSDYQQELTLPSKVKLEVAELKLWHEPGNTFVSLLFNMPVSEAQLRGRLSITPSVPFKIETEYCYAVLRGDFKPNVRYTVNVAPGLISKSGETLEKEYKGGVTIEDAPSHVEFAQRGNILSLSGPKTLALRTVNLDGVHVEIQKVFRNNLIQFLNNESYTPMSQTIFSSSYTVDGGQVNEELTQYVSLAGFHNTPYKGLFSIQVRDQRSYQSADQGWFLVTDLGMVAKESGDDLVVYVMSVETLRPQTGTLVQLYSDQNQVIDKKTTDESGKVIFPRWRKNEFEFRPYFIVAQKDDDFSFLSFNRTAMNQQQFPVGGDRYGQEGLEAFLTSERGVYRPGEKAFITAIVRRNDGSTPEAVPFRLKVTDPQGAEVQALEATPDARGMLSFTVPFAGDSLTGHYAIRLVRVDKNESIGSTSLKVEEFIPDKIKVEIETPQAAVQAGESLVFKVKARQMFGPPAAKSKVLTRVRYIAHNFAPEAFKGYVFTDPTRTFEEDEVDLGEGQLDDQGEKEYTVEVPRISPPSGLKAYVVSEVFDSGGRAVSAAAFADIHPYTKYVGIKLPNDQPVRVHDKLQMSLVDITPEGKLQTEEGVRIVVKRKAWYSIFRRSSWGRSTYQSSSYEELIENKTITLKGRGTFELAPQQPGDYSVIVVSPSGARSGVTFQVLGLGAETTSLESPEKLKIIPDKDAYNVGDQARFLIQTPFSGKLLLTLEREKIYETRIIEVTGRETSVTFTIEAQHLPNMYVVGVLLRTPDEARKTLPMVSFGIAPVMVKTSSRLVGMTWNVPKSVVSSKGLDVDLQIAGDAAATGVVLSAVDQGILQITNFVTPDPLGFFYRKRGLTTQSYSVFDMVLPDLPNKKFAIGGDEGGRFSRRHLNPIAAKKKKSMALSSGILTPGADGHIRYHFDTKGFNGEIRVMALAVRGEHFGSSSQSVQVADPIVLMPSYPRAIGPGDEFQIPVECYNKTGKQGTFTVRLSAKGPLKITSDGQQSFPLGPADQKKILFFAKAADDAGVATFKLSAEGAGVSVAQEEEISVRPGNPLTTRVLEGELKAGQSKTLDVPQGFIPFGQRLRVTVSNNPLIRYLRSLDYLIQYPYGCTEQITSRIFPLLYFKMLGFSTGRFEDKANSVDRFIQEGITELEKRQTPDGQFLLWPGGQEAGKWISEYAAHFLIEARQAGYTVSPMVMVRLHGWIQRGTVVPMNEGRLDRREHNTNTLMDTYLLFLKALMGTPDRESMTALLQTRLNSLGETDRALLSLSYSKLGDRETGEKILTPTFKSRFIYREQYGDFNSPIRNTAMYLSALTQANPQSSKIPQIVDYFGQELRDGHFGNTQENSWSFMALGQALNALPQNLQLTLQANGQPYRTITGADASFEDLKLSGKKLTVTNTGSGKAYYYLMAEGTPLLKNLKPEQKGLKIERTFSDKSGRSVNLENIIQGDLVVVSVTVQSEGEAIRNLIVVDILPAGFEVENPRLRSRGQLDYEPVMNFEPAFQDIRDDRILLFANELSGSRTFSYTVRAVTPGRFTIPNAYAEAMYDPAVHGEAVETRPLVIVDNNSQP